MLWSRLHVLISVTWGEFKQVCLKKADKHPVTTVLNKKENIKYLDLLHSQFVVVPVDKASKNIGIICKKIRDYKEITESGYFEPSNTTINEITSNYNGILQNLGDQQVYNPNLPFLYWIPKFHKVSTGFRYI